MKYSIYYPFIDRNISIDIDENRYNSFFIAHKKMTGIMLLEQDLYTAISNYEDYISYMKNFSQSWNQDNSNKIIHIAQMNINKIVSNFLSSCYAYMEHCNERIKVISDNINFKEKKKYFFNNIRLELTEHLRNHSQHYSFPIHSIKISNNEASITMETYINLDYMKSSSNEKRNKFLDKFFSKEEIMIEFNSLAYEYIKALYSLHKSILTDIIQLIEDCHALLNEAIEQINYEVNSKKTKMIKLIKKTNDGKVCMTFLNLELIERYKEIKEMNDILYKQHCSR